MNPPPYFTAVRLNNLGVTLLQRRSFSQAMVTFRDALKILRTCCRPGGQPLSSVQELSETASQRALETMANAKIDPLDVDVLQVSFDQAECDLHTVSSLLDAPLGHLFNAVQINEDPNVPHEMNTESAIMLHNYALANICMAKLRGSESYVSSAAYLWRSATKVMANSIADELAGSFEEENVVFLWALMLRNLAAVLHVLGENEESEEYAHALTLVFRPLDDLNLFVVDTVAAAAA